MWYTSEGIVRVLREVNMAPGGSADEWISADGSRRILFDAAGATLVTALSNGTGLRTRHELTGDPSPVKELVIMIGAHVMRLYEGDLQPLGN